MIKQFGIYLLSFAMATLIGYNLHFYLLPQLAKVSPINLESLYVFYGGFSFLLCLLFFLLSKTEKFKDQLGFLYLVSVALKIALFCIFFAKHIFTQDSFTNQESANLLIPMALMIILEVFFIGKLLNNLSALKNTK